MLRLNVHKFILVCLTGLVLLNSQLAAAEDTIPVLTLNLEMKARDADVLFKKDPYDRSTFPVSVISDGGALKGRISVKGSFTRNFDKKSLLIKLDKGEQWRGQKRIALNAMATDASMMREWLAWDLIRSLGMAAPKVNYTRLYINQRYIGMFLHIEWIDAKMMTGFGLGDDGELYHPRDENFCADLSPKSVANPTKCWLKLSPRDNNFTSLKQLVDELQKTSVSNFHAYLEENFDVESVLNWIAVNVLTSNGDTYNKNYFMYRSLATNRWVMIPWDYDLSFGRNWDEFLKYPANILNDNFQYFYPLELGLPNPLKDKLLKNPELLERLKQKLRALMGLSTQGAPTASPWFDPNVLTRRIDAIVDLLDDSVHRERYTVTNRKKLREHAEAMKDYVRFRYNFLKRTVLETSDWVADRVTVSVQKAGQQSDWVDGFGKTLGRFYINETNSKAKMGIEVEKSAVPEFTPQGVKPDRCIKRTWFLVDKTPYSNLNVDLELQYEQENSKLSEVGKSVTDESKLQLWVLYYDQWTRLPMQINTVSNVIKTLSLPLRAGRLYRFVACQP